MYVPIHSTPINTFKSLYHYFVLEICSWTWLPSLGFCPYFLLSVLPEGMSCLFIAQQYSHFKPQNALEESLWIRLMVHLVQRTVCHRCQSVMPWKAPQQGHRGRSLPKMLFLWHSWATYLEVSFRLHSPLMDHLPSQVQIAGKIKIWCAFDAKLQYRRRKKRC